MTHDSKAWTPLLFFMPIGWFWYFSQFEIPDIATWLFIYGVGVLLGLSAFLAQFHGIKPDWSTPEPGDNFRTEQAYLIRRVDDQYPMVVNSETLKKAMSAVDEYGDPAYEYEGPATYNEAGDHYVNDGSGGPGSYVPGGHIVVEKSVYQDERLN